VLAAKAYFNTSLGKVVQTHDGNAHRHEIDLW